MLARLSDPGESGVAAEINLESLRRYREESGFIPRMVYIPMPIFRAIYESEMWPLKNPVEPRISLDGMVGRIAPREDRGSA